MFIIPDDFACKMVALGGAEGRVWLDHLPGILAECSQRWEITIGPPFNLSYNYVAPAIRKDGCFLLPILLLEKRIKRESEHYLTQQRQIR